MGIFKKRFKIDVTIWGPDYVGTLDEAQDWFNHWQLIPRVGDSVMLPNSLRAARSKPDDEWGSIQETVTVTPGTNVGNVSYVLYGCRPGRRDISVGVKESEGRSE